MRASLIAGDSAAPSPHGGTGGARYERSALRSASFGDCLGQGLALDELHGVVVDAALAAHRINRDDVSVVELGGGQGLGLEPPELGRVHGRREREHLERHPAVQGTLHRLVDHPHAPAAHLGDQAEVAQVADPRSRLQPLRPPLHRRPAAEWSATPGG